MLMKTSDSIEVAGYTGWGIGWTQDLGTPKLLDCQAAVSERDQHSPALFYLRHGLT